MLVSHRRLALRLESDCIDLATKRDVGMSECRLTVSIVHGGGGDCVSNTRRL